MIPFFFKSCSFGKAHRLHSHMSTIMSHNAFDVVYTDLWGPCPIPFNSGYKYYVALVDGYTGYTWLYFLKQKFEVTHAFKLFHTFVKTQFNTIIKVV